MNKKPIFLIILFSMIFGSCTILEEASIFSVGKNEFQPIAILSGDKVSVEKELKEFHAKHIEAMGKPEPMAVPVEANMASMFLENICSDPELKDDPGLVSSFFEEDLIKLKQINQKDDKEFKLYGKMLSNLNHMDFEGMQEGTKAWIDLNYGEREFDLQLNISSEIMKKELIEQTKADVEKQTEGRIKLNAEPLTQILLRLFYLKVNQLSFPDNFNLGCDNKDAIKALKGESKPFVNQVNLFVAFTNNVDSLSKDEIKKEDFSWVIENQWVKQITDRQSDPAKAAEGEFFDISGKAKEQFKKLFLDSENIYLHLVIEMKKIQSPDLPTLKVRDLLLPLDINIMMKPQAVVNLLKAL